MATSWDNRFAQRTQRMKGSVIRELLKFTEEQMSFRLQAECPHRCFSNQGIHSSLQSHLDRTGDMALQYGSTDGYYPLREMIMHQSIAMALRSLQKYPNHFGSQQVSIYWARYSSIPGTALL
jgi:2-aminoadipate transaminase